MATRQFVMTRRPESEGESPDALGSRQDVVEHLAPCNTAPDFDTSECLHGPGMIMQLPPEQDSITQLLVSVFTDAYAWPVLIRICKETHWQLLDLETGRAFTAD